MSNKKESKTTGPTDGSVWQPMILWILGVPTGLVLLLWLFFFRGK